MTIDEIYKKYHIMPNLKQHMFRVTGVAEVLGRELLSTDELDDVITAALLHDMGNMAKFDLEYFPQFLEPEGLEHWQKIQNDFWAKYGKNAHDATLKILDELEVSDRVKALVNAVSFNKAKQTLDSDDYGRKICAYADMRVAPYGVVSLKERLDDGQKRYGSKDKKNTFSYVMGAYLRKIETQLFEKSSFAPEQITDEAVAPLLEKYNLWPV